MPGSGEYDGVIRIDSRIDTKNFNKDIDKMAKDGKKLDGVLVSMTGNGQKGIAAMSGALEGMISVLGETLIAVGTVAAAVVAVVVVVVAAVALAIGAIIVGLASLAAASIREFFNIEGAAQELKDSFQDLRNSFAIAFSPIVEYITPILQRIISFLIKVFNTIAMVVGALLGQKEVWQAVEGGTAQAAKNAKELGNNTEKAKKQAKGALAAFDEINVLQQKQDKTAGVTGGGAAPVGLETAAFEKVAIPQEIFDKIESYKQKFRDLIESIRKWFIDLWNNLPDWAKNALVAVGNFFVNAWENIKKDGILAWKFLKTTWGNLVEFFKPILEAWWNLVKGFWTLVGIILYDAWLTLKFVWGKVAEWFNENVIKPLKDFFAPFVDWFKENVTEPIRDAFVTAFEFIKSKFENIFNGIVNFAKSIFNRIIDFINSLISKIANGINSVISNVNIAGSAIPGFIAIPSVSAPHIPRLATGAVIPPNASFLAMLGDQKSGKNIEAPERLIRQIIREEIGNVQADVNINFEGSLSSLVRELKPIINKENVRIGSSLIKSGTTR